MSKSYKIIYDKFGMEDVGSALLDHLAKGLYPAEEVLREYIQNAIDAHRLWKRETHTDPDGPIQIEVRGDRLSVLDYGIGMDEKEIRGVKSIAVTTKIDTDIPLTGHKGVGIWAGLSFFNSLTLETTKRGSDHGYKLTILFSKIVDAIDYNSNIGQVMQNNYFIEEFEEVRDEHYTLITLEGPKRSIEWFTDVAKVKDTVQRMCPCPVDPNFVYHERVVDWYKQHNLEMFRIEVDGIPIYRSYPSVVEQFKASTITINDIVVAEYWYAIHHPNGKLIPTGDQQVGFRVVQSGFTLGKPNLYTDSLPGYKSLNKNNYMDWYVGEVHITSKSLRPNLQRDKLEESEDTRLFIQRIRKFYQKMEDNARNVADQRNNEDRIKETLNKYYEYEKHTNIIIDREALLSLLQLNSDDLSFLYAAQGELSLDEKSADTKKYLKDVSVRKMRTKLIEKIKMVLEAFNTNRRANFTNINSAKEVKAEDNIKENLKPNSLNIENTIEDESIKSDNNSPKITLLDTDTMNYGMSYDNTQRDYNSENYIKKEEKSNEAENQLIIKKDDVIIDEKNFSPEKEESENDKESDFIDSNTEDEYLSEELLENKEPDIDLSDKIPVVLILGLLEEVLKETLVENEEKKILIMNSFKERIKQVLLNV